MLLPVKSSLCARLPFQRLVELGYVALLFFAF